MDVDAAQLLLGNDASYGFNLAGALKLSPTLLERYLAAADRIRRPRVHRARGLPAPRVVWDGPGGAAAAK